MSLSIVKVESEKTDVDGDSLWPYWLDTETRTKLEAFLVTPVAPDFSQSTSAVMNTIMTVTYENQPPAEVAACARSIVVSSGQDPVREVERAYAWAMFAVRGVFDDIHRLEEGHDRGHQTDMRMVQRWPRWTNDLRSFIKVCRDLVADPNVIEYTADYANAPTWHVPLRGDRGTLLRFAHKTATAAEALLDEYASLLRTTMWREYYSLRLTTEAARVASLASSVVRGRFEWRVPDKYRRTLNDDFTGQAEKHILRLA